MIESVSAAAMLDSEGRRKCGLIKKGLIRVIDRPAVSVQGLERLRQSDAV